LKVDGLPQDAKPSLTLQLSSPVEEGTLNAVYDPLNDNPDAKSSNEGSIVVFRGVETTVATLTVTAKDVDIPLGSSTPHEVAPLCALDPMDIKDKYVTELPIAILAEDTAGATDAAVKEETLVQPNCTVTLRITYKPSPKDQREELYELLNKTSQRKATALENLRKISMQAATSRSDTGGSPKAGGGSVAKPSVKPGFLNKGGKTPESEAGPWKKLYNRTIGPNSALRRGAFLAFAAKDFFIFFGAVTFFHFKGQLLAIPPPV